MINNVIAPAPIARRVNNADGCQVETHNNKKVTPAILTNILQDNFDRLSVRQDWGDVSETRDHPGSRTRRTGEDLIEWTPIQQYQLKYGLRIMTPCCMALRSRPSERGHSVLM